LGAGSGLTQAALLLLAVTSGAPIEAANDAFLINELADGRDVLFWTQDDPAVFVSVSPLRSEWRAARHYAFYVMYTPDDASEVLVLRALLSCGGMRRCASQPRSWRRDAARPRKRSDHWLWPGSADGHMPESLWHGACWGGVAERLFWSWLTASGTFATTNRGSRAELCKAVVLACWCTARCGKPFACTRATDEHAAAAAASRGRGRRLSPGVDRAAGEASPGGVCASPVLLRRAGAFSRRRGSPLFFSFRRSARASGSTGAGRPFAMFCVCVWNVPTSLCTLAASVFDFFLRCVFFSYYYYYYIYCLCQNKYISLVSLLLLYALQYLFYY